MMRERNKSCTQGIVGRDGERGISLVEVLIVLAMISIVTAFAVMRIGGAQQAMRLTNSTREFTAWLEKARLDSLRRHPMSKLEMASVTINSANSYSIILDQNGDGTLDAARTITIPAAYGTTFGSITIPTTIYYNWRGRPVDGSGNPLNPTFNLHDANNSNTINLSSAGDVTLGNGANVSSVSVPNINNTANIRTKAVQ